VLDLNDFYYFVRVVDQGGFTAASKNLNVPKSTLSHRIQTLEQRLDARLISRTSRQFALTDVGREFYRHSVAMLEHAERAELAIKQRLERPSGTVRVTVGPAVAQFVLKGIILDFLRKHPQVSIVEHVTERIVDIVGENFDVAVRAHSRSLPDSALICRVLAPSPWHLFASPKYLDERGVPQTPEELSRHSHIHMMRSGIEPEWHLENAILGKSRKVVPLAISLSSDDIVTLVSAASAGLGIAALPSYVCRAEVRAGTLTKVLPEWSAGEATISALIPHRLGSTPAIRAFVGHLAAEFPRVLSAASFP
jgi:DNA-binding transcriptional LysR family regulator